MKPSPSTRVLVTLSLVSCLVRAEESKPDHTFGLDAAQAQVKQMSVGDGLEVTLFAAEPMVLNPADMDIDSRGRVWVTEGANYRSSFQKWGVLRPEGDRIQILADTNGDGVADEAKTFYQDLSINAALGICVLGNEVIVSASPYIFRLIDTNGDDVADRRELLFITDPKQADHDHAAHAFVFGPDGRLYFNFGNAGGFLRRPSASLREIPLHGKLPLEELMKGELVKDVRGIAITGQGKPYRQGMAFRCEPDGSKVEVLGHNFRNNYELAVDSYGTVWQPDNDDDGNQGVRINYVMEHGNYGYTDEMTGAGWQKARTGWEAEIPRRHWHLNDPGVVPNLLQTGAGSPTGICFYEGDLLPAAFQNQPIHCDAGPRVVRGYPFRPDGAGYTAAITNVLTSPNDTWFRPSDVAVAPDGSLYVADWNDAGVGGHFMKDQTLATMTGRIYRVAPKGHKPNVPPQDFGSSMGAADALRSPNVATRQRAFTTLVRMGASAEPRLLKMWGDPNPVIRARVLHLLARLPGKTAGYVEAAIGDANADIRITGLRIARQFKLNIPAIVARMASDREPQVRRECAIALFRDPSPEVPALWVALARGYDGQDRWYLEALGIGAEGNWDACLTSYLQKNPDATRTAAGRGIIWRSRAKESPSLLVKILNEKDLALVEQPRYLRALDFLSGPEKDAALLELATGATK